MTRREIEVLLIRANAMLFQRGEVLADFEAGVIEEAHRRVVWQRGALPTQAELQVIQDALTAMLAAPRQDLTNMGLAA